MVCHYLRSKKYFILFLEKKKEMMHVVVSFLIPVNLRGKHDELSNLFIA